MTTFYCPCCEVARTADQFECKKNGSRNVTCRECLGKQQEKRNSMLKNGLCIACYKSAPDVQFNLHRKGKRNWTCQECLENRKRRRWQHSLPPVSVENDRAEAGEQPLVSSFVPGNTSTSQQPQQQPHVCLNPELAWHQSSSCLTFLPLDDVQIPPDVLSHQDGFERLTELDTTTDTREPTDRAGSNGLQEHKTLDHQVPDTSYASITSTLLLWTKEEDDLLIELVKRDQGKGACWKRVAQSHPRSARSCRVRYQRYLDPARHRPKHTRPYRWTAEETRRLGEIIRQRQSHGHLLRWKAISKELGSCSESACADYHRTNRHQFDDDADGDQDHARADCDQSGEDTTTPEGSSSLG